MVKGITLVKGYMACIKRPPGMQPPHIHSSPFELESMAQAWVAAFPNHELVYIKCMYVHPSRLITAANCQWEEKNERSD